MQKRDAVTVAPTIYFCLLLVTHWMTQGESTNLRVPPPSSGKRARQSFPAGKVGCQGLGKDQQPVFPVSHSPRAFLTLSLFPLPSFISGLFFSQITLLPSNPGTRPGMTSPTAQTLKTPPDLRGSKPMIACCLQDK